MWRSDVATIALATGLVAVAARGYVAASGRARRDRLTALQAAAALGAVLVRRRGGAASRCRPGMPSTRRLLAYEAVLVAIAVGLYARLRGRPRRPWPISSSSSARARSGTLRDRLAHALRDPTLEVGYWSAGGERLPRRPEALPRPPRNRVPGAPRRAWSATGSRYAVLAHDEAVLGDAALAEAVASATRLSASNVALQGRGLAAGGGADGLATASPGRRRRGAAAAGGAGSARGRSSGWRGWEETLGRTCPGASTWIERGASSRTRCRDLQRLARGLHPRELSAGRSARGPRVAPPSSRRTS